MAEFIWAKNRPSPKNEPELIEAYKKAVPVAANEDLYDISAVITIDGVIGHGLLYFADNRSKDDKYHKCYHFVSDYALKSFM